MNEHLKWRDFYYVQHHENDLAQVVIVSRMMSYLTFKLHEPSLPNWMGSIHPNGSLYEFPVDVVAAKKEHDNFRRELENLKIKVFSVQEILLMVSI
jgi:arginine deiminase